MNAECHLVGLESPSNRLLGDAAVAGLGNTLGESEGWTKPCLPASGGKPATGVPGRMPPDLHSSPLTEPQELEPGVAAGGLWRAVLHPCS